MESRIDMSRVDDDFSDACHKVEELYIRLNNSTIRKIYAYYKQATVGDITGKRPSVLRLRERIKFESWSSISGMSKDDAKIAYIDLVNNLNFDGDEISCDEREARLNNEHHKV